MAIYSVDEILNFIIRWEKKLGYFYILLEDYLKDGRSRRMMRILKEQQDKILQILDKIDVEAYKNIEFMKNAPSYRSEAVIPHLEINADSSPRAVLESVLDYEEKMEELYLHLFQIAVYSKSQELFDMLKQLKIGQIKKIRSFLDTYDLVV